MKNFIAAVLLFLSIMTTAACSSHETPALPQQTQSHITAPTHVNTEKYLNALDNKQFKDNKDVHFRHGNVYVTNGVCDKKHPSISPWKIVKLHVWWNKRNHGRVICTK